MKIICLTENTSEDVNLISEHGLSLYIETENKKILFDTGQSNAFLINAEKLNIDLAKVDFAIISHGHYDHGGGLKYFLNANKKAPVYISRYAFEPFFHGKDKYIGLDKAIIENERFIFVQDNCSIDENIKLYSCNTFERKYMTNSNELFIKKNEKLITDNFFHEQYLVIKDKDRKILISGCSHKGIMNIINWFSPKIFVGGFHLSKLSIKEDYDALNNIREELNKYNTKYYTCHCTGVKQYEFLKNKLEKKLSYLSTGKEIEL